MKKSKKKKHANHSKIDKQSPEQILTRIYESRMKELNKMFGAAVKKIPKILCKYNVGDIATSLFVSSMWLPNISSLIKHQLLAAIFASLKPEEFSNLRAISSYSDFSHFSEEIYFLLPTFVMLEDYVPKIDWGDVKFHHGQRNYKIFYGNELSNVYDYLTLFQMLYLQFEEKYRKFANRSPDMELQYCLQLQDEIISGITSQPVIEEIAGFSPGHIEIPSRQFWQNATEFYSNFKPQHYYEESFLKNYSLQLGSLSQECLKLGTFQDMVFRGKVLPKFFIQHKDQYLPILPRRYSSILFDSWSKICEENYAKIARDGVPYSMSIGGELYRYIKTRINSKFLYPFVSAVTQQGSPHEILFSTAFVSQDRLTLVYVTNPNYSKQKTEEEINKISPKLEEALNLIAIHPPTLALHRERQNVQFQSRTNAKTLKPLLFVIIPQVSTEIDPISIPVSLPGEVMFLDQFLGILDELEDVDILASFMEYMEKYDDLIKNPVISTLDKFGSFRSSYGVLVEGAQDYSFISLDPHWGSNMRYETLSEFWKVYPDVHFFDHPRSWKVKRETESRVRLEARGYLGCALYCQVGSTHIFLNSPFDKMSYEQGQILNLCMECLEDSISKHKNIIEKHKYFQTDNQFQVLIFPLSLISENDSFKHLKHLNPNGELWCSDYGMMKPAIYGIRIVIDDKLLMEAFMKVEDRSLEIDLLLEVLSSLNEIIPDTDIASIINSLEDQKKGKPRFKMFKANKMASFPEFVNSYKPQHSHFKKARKRIAELAKVHGLVEGYYSFEEAKIKLNAMREAIIAEIDYEVEKYDFKKCIPFLLTRADALTDRYERSTFTIKESLEHDVDYNRGEHYSSEETEYIRTYKNYRYLIEKFVQLHPQGRNYINKDQFQNLIALIDWLHTFYMASDSLHYNLYPVGMRVNDQFLIDVIYDDSFSEKQKKFREEKAMIDLGVGINQEDRVYSPRSLEEFMDALDIAFQNDLGFTIRNMVNVLQVLTHWPDFRQGVDLSPFYCLDGDEIREACSQVIKEFNSGETAPILKFLTLKSDEVIRLTDQEEICDDIPVWEHRKRFSRYSIRPLMVIDDKYYWAPHSTRKSALIWTNNLSYGTLPADLESPTIQKELDREKTFIENALEIKATEIVRRFTVHTEKNCWIHKRDRTGNHPIDLGDYDVLAFYQDKNIVLNIECKDILPPYCLKDATRLRRKIFGNNSEDEGHFKQIKKRQDYLSENLLSIACILKWPIDFNNPPKIITIYLTRLTYWWTRFPPKDVDTVFLQVDQLSEFIEDLEG